jgi:inorganic pyrophosphatase
LEMKTVMAMVECPGASTINSVTTRMKNALHLSKILPAGLTFPFDFGFITDTKGEDGDPLDMIIVSEITGFPGCVIECRLIGSLAAEHTERDGKTIRNDRIPVSRSFPSFIRK